MKIVTITGSPRKNGASSRIAEGFSSAAEKMDCEVIRYHLNEMNYRGCQGCNRCKMKSPVCVLNDDLSHLLQDLAEADIAVLASPVYYGDTTGQFKCFIDRTWSYVKPNFKSKLEPGKKALFILTQGFGEERHGDVCERYTAFLKLYGFDVTVLRAPNCSADPSMDVNQYIDEASKLAEEWLSRD